MCTIYLLAAVIQVHASRWTVEWEYTNLWGENVIVLWLSFCMRVISISVCIVCVCVCVCVCVLITAHRTHPLPPAQWVVHLGWSVSPQRASAVFGHSRQVCTTFVCLQLLAVKEMIKGEIQPLDQLSHCHDVEGIIKVCASALVLFM